jgi:ABC-type branched-subunit amino acid transport system ATPase component/ABC-type branched-subunit amino acid transport system permease subunit
VRGHLTAGGLAVLLALYPAVQPGQTYRHTVLLLAFLLAIQAVSWNIISGYAGYISLGHSVFLGIGAYTVGILAMHWHVNPLALAPLGGVVTTLTAVGVGAVVLRTRGHAFVIVTIAVLLAVQVLAVNLRWLTNGSDGITLPLPSWPGRWQNIPFYYTFLGLLVLTVALSAWVRRTKFGAGLVAIRDDEGKAAAIGVPATRYKILAYAMSAFFIGVAGGVHAYFLTYINPVGEFDILISVMVVLSALLGGRGTLYGPVLGAFAVQFGSETATNFGSNTQSRVLIFGLALVLVVLLLPAGVLPTIRAHLARLPRFRTFPESASSGSPRPALSLKMREVGSGPLLEVRGLTKRFGGVVAVGDTDLTVHSGTVTGLIGPNGSGKTTLFNLVTGGLRADGGEILFDGRRIDRLPPWQRCHLGIARTFQLARPLRSMTVLQNVVAPPPDGRWRTLARDAVSGPEAKRARELLDFVGLSRFADQPAGSLSYGQQKLVELAQALMLEPRLVLLDEPASGINPALVERIADIVRELNRLGVTFLVIEHNIPLVLDICDPVVVFSRGSPVATGTPEAIRRDPAVVSAYLGQAVST